MLDTQTRDALIAWLDWQLAMGADAAVDAEATDWLARGPAVPGEGMDFGARPEAKPPPSAAREPAADTPRGPAPVSRPPSAPSVRPMAPAPAAPAALPPGARPAGPAPAPAQPARPAGAEGQARPAAPRQFPTAAPDAAEASARRLAASAKSLEDLQALLAAFDGCALKATAKNLCFYRGAKQAPIMLIGEAPGREEDLEGKPFVGPAGQLLEKMLKAAGLGEADVHITNVVYWRPPGNRTPTPQEVQVCRPFLERQVELVAPRVIMPLGGAAAKAILDVAEGISRVRGKWRDITIASHSAKALATLHPAYLLRTTNAKRLAWRDLLAVKAELGLF